MNRFIENGSVKDCPKIGRSKTANTESLFSILLDILEYSKQYLREITINRDMRFIEL